MARSRKKTPVFGNTTSESDKEYKKQQHRRERRAVKVALAVSRRIPDAKLFGDPWGSQKDGKHYWSNAAKEDMRK